MKDSQQHNIAPYTLSFVHRMPALLRILGFFMLIGSAYLLVRTAPGLLSLNHALRDTPSLALAALLGYLGNSLAFGGSRVTIHGTRRQVVEERGMGLFNKRRSYHSNELQEVNLGRRIEGAEGNLEGPMAKRNFVLKIALRESGKPPLHISNLKSVEQAREAATRIAGLLEIPFIDQLPKEATVINVEPDTGTVISSKLESRDLSYRFFIVAEKREDALVLQELEEMEVKGPAAPGVDGWTRPVVPASSVSHQNTMHADGELADDEETGQVIVRREGSHFVDQYGRVYEVWDGLDKPFRFV